MKRILPSLEAILGWLERADAGLLPGDSVASRLAGPDAAVGPCSGENLSGWCFEAPATPALGAGESRQLDLRVAAPGRHPKPLPKARLFARDNRGRDAASVALALRAASASR